MCRVPRPVQDDLTKESPDIIQMAHSWGFHLARVPMKNTHHAVMYELLITSYPMN